MAIVTEILRPPMAIEVVERAFFEHMAAGIRCLVVRLLLSRSFMSKRRGSQSVFQKPKGLQCQLYCKFPPVFYVSILAFRHDFNVSLSGDLTPNQILLRQGARFLPFFSAPISPDEADLSCLEAHSLNCTPLKKLPASFCRVWDAVVIGGGHNGLTAAAYLAKAGKSVAVLERRHVLGGAAVTEEIIPGFKFSRCSYLQSLLRPQIIRCGLASIQGMLNWRRMCFVHNGPKRFSVS